jgi:8-oxo-dGTP diphosphatase
MIVDGVDIGETVPGFRDGVAVVVVRRDDAGRPRILVGLRRGAHGSGTWALPGGKPEPDEPLNETASRELLEETGLTSRFIRYLGDTLDSFEESQRWRAHFLLVEAEGEPQILEPHKCDRWEWHDIASLPTPLFAPVRSLLESGGFDSLLSPDDK